MPIFLMHRLPAARRRYHWYPPLPPRMCSHLRLYYDLWAREVLPFLDLNLIGLSLPAPFPPHFSVDPVQHRLHSRFVHLPGVKIQVQHLSMTIPSAKMRKQRSMMSLWPVMIMIHLNERKIELSFLNQLLLLLILLILDDLALALSREQFLSTLTMEMDRGRDAIIIHPTVSVLSLPIALLPKEKERKLGPIWRLRATTTTASPG